jgi:hypothetical protein
LSSTDTTPADATAVLRTLLDTPKPKDDAWQTEAGRAVSLLAVRFLNEGNDEAALRSVALLGLAQSLGVKEARKRTLKLTRWSEVTPPPLTTLAQRDEQQAALAGLAKLSAPWSRAYAERALSDPALPEDFLPDLLRWARSTFADNLSFTQDCYAPQIAAAKPGERAAALMKEAGKLLKPVGPEPAPQLAQGIAVLVDALMQSPRSGTEEDKSFVASVGALLHLVQDHAAVAPAILLQPGFVTAFARLSGRVSKGAASKQVTAVADALALATISILAADVERHGRQAATHWGALVPAWRSAYANWDATMAAAVRATPALAAMTANRAEDSPAGEDAYAAEAVFARLLPAWNAFVAELPDASRAASLSSMLQQAAGTLGIVPLGEAGAVVGYDPLSHHLAEEADASPSQVRIVRPGVQVRRPDGSARVLVAALVAAV